MEVTDFWTMPEHNRMDNGSALQSMTAALATDELTTAELKSMIPRLQQMIEVRSTWVDGAVAMVQQQQQQQQLLRPERHR